MSWLTLFEIVNIKISLTYLPNPGRFLLTVLPVTGSLHAKGQAFVY